MVLEKNKPTNISAERLYQGRQKGTGVEKKKPTCLSETILNDNMPTNVLYDYTGFFFLACEWDSC